MAIEPFYLIITDSDKGVFNIVGPMKDDTNWNKKVCDEQDKGRHVKCQSANNALSLEELKRRVSMQLSLKHTDEPIL
jgi:hypothetical protein